MRAAVVTCGGLCPGLNSVIHHLVNTLLLTYKAEKVRVVRDYFAIRQDLAWTVDSNTALTNAYRRTPELRLIVSVLTEHGVL